MQPAHGPNNDDSERRLLTRTLNGDREALGTLIGRHLPALRAFVRLRVDRSLRAREADSDIVQSVCRELLQHLDSFEYRGETCFRNWLYVAVLNKIRQKKKYYHAEKRDRRREVSTGGREESDSLVVEYYRSFCTPSRHVAAREQLDRVEAALDMLPEHYREVITLAKIVGLSQAELAEQMERTVPSVRNLLSRALVRLAVTLDELDR